MEPEFITYQKFNDPALAEELAEQLEQHGIPYEMEEQSLTFNITFVLNDPLQKEYAVKIKSEDFEKANQLLKEDESKNIEGLDKDYYLYSFTNDELMDVVSKADEWSAFDVVLARKLLGERGVAISETTISAIKEKRIEELKKPEPSQLSWVIVGYMIAIGGIVIAFGVIIWPFFINAMGLFIGWHLSSYKKTLPDGEKVYGYNETDRAHGKRIFYLSIIVFVLSLAYLLFIKS